MDLAMAAHATPPRRRPSRRATHLIDLERQEDGPTLKTGDVARLTGLGPFMVRQMIQAGEIRAGRIGKCYKIPWRSLRAYCFRVKLLPLRAEERR